MTPLFIILMQIHVHTISGRKHSLDVEGNQTILSVKQQLEAREGISVVQQKLLFRGQNVPDNETIENCHISPGDVLHMALSLRAGK